MQLVIEDAIGCCTTNGFYDAKKADAFFGNVGAGVLDSAGRNVDPMLMNLIQVGTKHIGRLVVSRCGAALHEHNGMLSLYSVCLNLRTDL